MKDQHPTVSFGMPVYNGSRFIRQALDSVLAQTYTDFEVIICDNASTDDTQAICEEYAKKDARIRYVRNPVNLGAAPNYNKSFELSNGRYFNWFAHDDLLAPDYLQRCVTQLDENPDAILCASVVRIIDQDGEELEIYHPPLSPTETSSSPAVRFAPMALVAHTCTDFFGLFRSEQLAKTGLHGFYHGCDRAFLAEIALMGKILRLPDPAFSNREHESRYSRAVSAEQRSLWHTASGNKKIGLFTWQLYCDYIAAVNKRVSGFGEKLRCYGVLLKWWLVNLNSLRMASDFVTYILPSIFPIAEKIKNKLIKPQHAQVARK